jgi:hypothetical protein
MTILLYLSTKNFPNKTKFILTNYFPKFSFKNVYSDFIQ